METTMNYLPEYLTVKTDENNKPLYHPHAEQSRVRGWESNPVKTRH